MRRLVERSFTTAADPERTWAHLAAVERWPSWARHIRRITLTPPGALTPGTRGRLILRPGVPSTFLMTRLDSGRSWSWRGRVAGTTLDYDHVIAPDPRGSRVTFTIDGSGPTVAVVGRVFAAVYARILDRAIARLVAELDAIA